MSIKLIRSFLLLLFAFPAAAQNKLESQSKSKLACDENLQQHIYRRERLQVREGCVTVRGEVMTVQPERDGDVHVLLLLSSGQNPKLINKVNVEQQSGALLLEIICATRKRGNRRKACQNYKNPIRIPHSGELITVTGLHVLDRDHGWLELHPVTEIGTDH